jgi:anaerobic ribonucleoside-triphosphate reductase activating protein
VLQTVEPGAGTGPGLAGDLPGPAGAVAGGAVRPLKVGGVTPFSATDYPGKLAAVVFVQGCPWRCGYCHNPHLQTRTGPDAPSWDQVMALLQRRVGLIDAVVFSGGEPTIDPALAQAMRAVRALGFGVGLHTAGAYPRRLAEVLPLVDWVGIDIKAHAAAYDVVTRIADSARHAFTSAELVLASGVAHEFRTTVHPELHTEQDTLALARTLRDMGVRHYALQQFRATGCQDPQLTGGAAGGAPSEALLTRLAALFDGFVFRQS